MTARLYPVLWTLGTFAATGCEDESSAADGTQTTDPSSPETGQSSADDTASTEDEPNFPRGRECEATTQCEPGESCVATYDPGRYVPEVGHCISDCIAAGDDVRWCTDSASCCSNLGCDVIRGLCEPKIFD